MKIDGHTKLIAIFGWPLTYTRSPGFQNAGLTARKLNAAYLPFPVEARDFFALWRTLSRLPNFLGANVTNPHKQVAFKLADLLSPEARAVGAVNTLYRRGHDWIGHNTDIQGFLRALPIPLKGKNITVLGAGGTARAVVAAGIQSRAGQIEIACRRAVQGKELLRALKAPSGICRLRLLDKESLEDILSRADLLINTVPGQDFAAKAAKALGAGRKLRLVADLSYAPPHNALLRAAGRRGIRTLNGLGMLLEQGCLSFECWTGKKAPKSVMRRALGH